MLISAATNPPDHTHTHVPCSAAQLPGESGKVYSNYWLSGTLPTHPQNVAGHCKSQRYYLSHLVQWQRRRWSRGVAVVGRRATGVRPVVKNVLSSTDRHTSLRSLMVGGQDNFSLGVWRHFLYKSDTLVEEMTHRPDKSFFIHFNYRISKLRVTVGHSTKCSWLQSIGCHPLSWRQTSLGVV